MICLSPVQKLLPYETLIHDESPYSYILSTDAKSGSMLLEICADRIIVWNNELSLCPFYELYSTLMEKCIENRKLFIVAIDNSEEVSAIIRLGGYKTEEYDTEYDSTYGTYCLWKQNEEV